MKFTAFNLDSYAEVSCIPCIRPAVLDDLQSKAFSKGAIKVPKKSKINGEHFDNTVSISGSVIVLNIIGGVVVS